MYHPALAAWTEGEERRKKMEARAQKEDIIGIYQEDGSVKCRNCMTEEDWKNLADDRIITEDRVKNNNEFIYCDYCEERL